RARAAGLAARASLAIGGGRRLLRHAGGRRSRVCVRIAPGGNRDRRDPGARMAGMITVRGAEVEAEHSGRSGGPTLVFLHEVLGSLGLWRDFPRKVSDATGLPAFVYSRAGYGKSDPAPLPRPVRYMHDEAALLPDVLKAAGIDDPVLVGHSDGASISIIHAGSGGKARALVLEAPHVFTEGSGLES